MTGKMEYVSKEKRRRVLDFLNDGKCYGDAATRFKLSVMTINKLVALYERQLQLDPMLTHEEAIKKLVLPKERIQKYFRKYPKGTLANCRKYLEGTKLHPNEPIPSIMTISVTRKAMGLGRKRKTNVSSDEDEELEKYK